jgi:hypothetical protein
MKLQIAFAYPNEVTFNLGLNIKDRVQIIFHIYSSQAQRSGASIVESLFRVKMPGKEAKG